MIQRIRASLLLLPMIVGLVVVLTIVGFFANSNLGDIRSVWFMGGCTSSLDDDNAVHTTVVYLYHGDDELYPDNLIFFLRHGVREDDGNRYYVILPQSTDDRDKYRQMKSVYEDDSFEWCTCTLGCPKNKNKSKDQDKNMPSPTDIQQSQQWISNYFGGSWSRSRSVDNDGCDCKCPKSMTTIELPRNVILVYHDERRSSSGSSSGSSSSSSITLDALLTAEGIDGDHLLRSSQYYILLDSTVRGPFLPLYLNNYAGSTPTTAATDKKGEHGEERLGLSPSATPSSPRRCLRPYRWTDAFTSKITDTVKLVGSTLACSPSPHVVSLTSYSYNIPSLFLNTMLLHFYFPHCVVLLCSPTVT